VVGRACSICIHKRRAEIDVGLLSGRTHADLARQFNVSNDAISRHAKRHVSVLVAAGADQPHSSSAGPIDLVTSIAALQERVMVLLRKAERGHNLRAALAAVHEAAGLLTLLGKMSGAIGADGVRLTVNLGVGGGSAAVRERIFAKLAALSGPDRIVAGRVVDVE
jgi:hypothetical protein